MLMKELFFYSNNREDSELTYKDIDFKYKEVEESKYDYVIKFYDYIPDTRDIKKNGLIIINSNICRSSLIEKLEVCSSIENEYILVLHDVAGGQLGKKFVKNVFSQYLKNVVCLYEIPLDTIDVEYRYKLEYSCISKFKYLSKELVSVLKKITIIITGKNERQVSEAIKRLREGK